MLLVALVTSLAFLSSTNADPLIPSQPTVSPNDHEHFNYFAFKLADSTPLHARTVAESFGMHYVGPVGELNGYYQAALRKEEVSRWARRRRRDSFIPADSKDAEVVGYDLLSHDSIQWTQVQVPRRLERRAEPVMDSSLEAAKAFGISDPEFPFQWHLVNHSPEQIGNDHNVTAAWDQGIFGNGTVVCIVDDGLYHESADLKDNFFAEGSYDFNDHMPDPSPKTTYDRHGTRCAGEIAAVKNGVCGVGIAYESKVSAVRILGGEVTQADEAASVNYKFNENHIYSCSWGPTDDGKTMEAPSTLVAEAFINGVTNGRGGLGSIFVFASGNGGMAGDNCNFDGFTNSIYTITVGAVDRFGRHPEYSEKCSANLVVMFSSSDSRHNDAIATTDWKLGLTGDLCTRSHGGTSAAAPLAAGIYALVHSIRPDLNWRDFQHLSVRTAVSVSPNDPSWFKTAAGRMYSHAFGYGKLDAYWILEAAKVWESVPAQIQLRTEFVGPVGGDSVIPQEKGADSRVQILVTEEMLSSVGLNALEHVTVTVNIDHQRRGDVNVDLVSPNGVVSQLAVGRKSDADVSGFRNWTFMSVAHWDESALGLWQVVVSDQINPGKTGVFHNASITFWGSAGIPVIPSVELNPHVIMNASKATNESIFVPEAPSFQSQGWILGECVLVLSVAAFVLWFATRRKKVSKRERIEDGGVLFKRLDSREEDEEE
ncbi:pheromone processing endoprotease [Podochytrium sp. JEL0797]|nr:pheromone processing endoprotease [Podochytrium sp. JEL0797]